MRAVNLVRLSRIKGDGRAASSHLLPVDAVGDAEATIGRLIRILDRDSLRAAITEVLVDARFPSKTTR